MLSVKQYNTLVPASVTREQTSAPFQSEPASSIRKIQNLSANPFEFTRDEAIALLTNKEYINSIDLAKLTNLDFTKHNDGTLKAVLYKEGDDRLILTLRDSTSKGGPRTFDLELTSSRTAQEKGFSHEPDKPISQAICNLEKRNLRFNPFYSLVQKKMSFFDLILDKDKARAGS